MGASDLKQISVKVDPELHQKVRIRAASLEMSMAEYARQLVKKDIARDESVLSDESEQGE